jgi:hypothetical protein
MGNPISKFDHLGLDAADDVAYSMGLTWVPPEYQQQMQGEIEGAGTALADTELGMAGVAIGIAGVGAGATYACTVAPTVAAAYGSNPGYYNELLETAISAGYGFASGEEGEPTSKVSEYPTVNYINLALGLIGVLPPSAPSTTLPAGASPFPTPPSPAATPAPWPTPAPLPAPTPLP